MSKKRLFWFLVSFYDSLIDPVDFEHGALWQERVAKQFCSLCSGQNMPKRRWAPQYPSQGHLPSSLAFLQYVSLSKVPLLPPCETAWESGLWQWPISKWQHLPLSSSLPASLSDNSSILWALQPSMVLDSPFSLPHCTHDIRKNPVNLSISLSAGSITKYCKLGDFFFFQNIF